MGSNVSLKLFLVIVLIFVGSLIGTFVSLSEKLAQTQSNFPKPINIFQRRYISRFQWDIFGLCLLNAGFSIPFYCLLVYLIFPLLDKIFSEYLVQLLIAFSLALAVAKKRANISLLNSLLGGFDLETLPIIKDVVQSLIEIYDRFYSGIIDNILNKVETISFNEAKEEAKQTRKRIDQIAIQYPNTTEAMTKLITTIETDIIPCYPEISKTQHRAELNNILTGKKEDKYVKLIEFYERINC